MPIVAFNPALRSALMRYMEANERSKSNIASEFDIDPMTLGRFLKSGKVIDANRQKLEEGLSRVGAWVPANDAQTKGGDIALSEKVIAALEFLLAAARQHVSSTPGGEG
jgi:hypothetical protein